MRDFWDEGVVRGVYYPELERQLVELTGGAQALLFDHTLRQRAPGRPPLDGADGSFTAVRDPVGVHNLVHRWFYSPQQLRDELTVLSMFHIYDLVRLRVRPDYTNTD